MKKAVRAIILRNCYQIYFHQTRVIDWYDELDIVNLMIIFSLEIEK
jgi:hypothetical protein